MDQKKSQSCDIICNMVQSASVSNKLFCLCFHNDLEDMHISSFSRTVLQPSETEPWLVLFVIVVLVVDGFNTPDQTLAHTCIAGFMASSSFYLFI